MIIGIDASRANRDHKSGTEWYAYYLIKGLVRLDDKNEYILYTDQPLTAGLLDLTCDIYTACPEEKIEYDQQGYQVIKSPHNNVKAKVLGWPFKFLWTQGRMSLEMLFHAPDILFIPAHALPIIHPKKSVVTIHDIGFKMADQLYSKDLIIPKDLPTRKLFNLLIKILGHGKYHGSHLDYLHWSTEYAIKKAKKIITISNFSKREILKHYQADAQDIEIVYNGYNKKLYRQINDQEKINQVLDKYGITKPFIFYIGRLEKKKNTDKLIEAFAIMKQHHPDIKHKLCLVGDASFGYDEIKYQINEFGLSDDVIIPGWVEEEDVPYIYNATTAFVFPSNYEGFGIPLLQAMACGTPNAASDVASIPEITQDAALLFNPEDVADMADNLAKIIKDDKKRQELIENGLARVQNFSWEKCAQETLKIFNNL